MSDLWIERIISLIHLFVNIVLLVCLILMWVFLMETLEELHEQRAVKEEMQRLHQTAQYQQDSWFTPDKDK